MTTKHLIIVPGHGIWKFTNDGSSASDWFLESFQLEGHDHLFFIQHITDAFKVLNEDPSSIVMFSGGQTKVQAGSMSEAQSYFFLAQRLGLIDDSNKGRLYTEEYARDSFENVLFSLARFKEVTGMYPERITITGFEFKRHRFLDLHLPTLNFARENVEYIGCDPTPDYVKGSEEWIKYFEDLKNAENRHAVQKFQEDPLGNGPVLGKKKAGRNPFMRSHSYVQTNPELAVFFTDVTDLSGVSTPWASNR